MVEKPLLYFKHHSELRAWLQENHNNYKGVYLVFYKVASAEESMRWEEAVKVALCFGWIDSTVKSLGNGKRQQYFSPRNPKSVWSALNKKYLKALFADNLMHPKGIASIEIAKENGSWTALDDVENLIIPKELQDAFDKNTIAYENYLNFAKSYKKSYLYWLSQGKREATRQKRLTEIISLCERNIKSRDNW
jgi:uncharacterized protein YdeI (YjbR/CyaY-like superfamily)